MDRKPPQILKVRDLEGDERFQDIHPNLMSCPSLTVIVGAIKSSKSNLIINLFCNNDFFWDKKK